MPELVTFYQSVSLREYNRTLDTRLLYPVSRLPFDCLVHQIVGKVYTYRVSSGTTNKMLMLLGESQTSRRSR